MKEERFKISMVIISVFLIAVACLVAYFLVSTLKPFGVLEWIYAIIVVGIMGIIFPLFAGVGCLLEQIKLLFRKEKT